MAGETNPGTPSSDEKSAKAPGVRTEAEVKADEKAAAEAAAKAAKEAAEKAAKGTTPAKENPDKLVHYERESDGTVQSVNEGTPEHDILESSAGWKKTTRAKAKAFEPRRFVSTRERAKAAEKAAG